MSYHDWGGSNYRISQGKKIGFGERMQRANPNIKLRNIKNKPYKTKQGRNIWHSLTQGSTFNKRENNGSRKSFVTSKIKIILHILFFFMYISMQGQKA